jgi:hypothetical protein
MQSTAQKTKKKKERKGKEKALPPRYPTVPLYIIISHSVIKSEHKETVRRGTVRIGTAGRIFSKSGARYRYLPRYCEVRRRKSEDSKQGTSGRSCEPNRADPSWSPQMIQNSLAADLFSLVATATSASSRPMPLLGPEVPPNRPWRDSGGGGRGSQFCAATISVGTPGKWDERPHTLEGTSTGIMGWCCSMYPLLCTMAG